jgi:hypothetical protein
MCVIVPKTERHHIACGHCTARKKMTSRLKRDKKNHPESSTPGAKWIRLLIEQPYNLPQKLTLHALSQELRNIRRTRSSAVFVLVP